MNNDFVKKLKKNKYIKNKKTYPNIDKLLKLYYNKFINDLDKFNYFKIFVIILIFIYIIFIFYILLGWFSPPQFLLYHILVCITVLIIYENNNISILNIILKLLFNKTIDILPINYEFIKSIVIYIIIISFIGIINTKYTAFELIKKYLNI